MPKPIRDVVHLRQLPIGTVLSHRLFSDCVVIGHDGEGWPIVIHQMILLTPGEWTLEAQGYQRPAELQRLAKERNQAKLKVEEWMRQESLAGELRENRDCPYWDEYKRAETMLLHAIVAVGT